MAVNELAKAIREQNKGEKPNKPVFDPEIFPRGSIIAGDLSTFLYPFIKSDEGSLDTVKQLLSPQYNRAHVFRTQDKLEYMYIKKLQPRGW